MWGCSLQTFPYLLVTTLLHPVMSLNTPWSLPAVIRRMLLLPTSYFTFFLFFLFSLKKNSASHLIWRNKGVEDFFIFFLFLLVHLSDRLLRPPAIAFCYSRQKLMEEEGGKVDSTFHSDWLDFRQDFVGLLMERMFWLILSHVVVKVAHSWLDRWFSLRGVGNTGLTHV